MKSKYLKITVRIKKHGAAPLETTELFVVINESESINTLLQMIYGGYYDIIDYKAEPVEIYVSKNYIKTSAIEILSGKV